MELVKAFKNSSDSKMNSVAAEHEELWLKDKTHGSGAHKSSSSFVSALVVLALCVSSRFN